MELINAVDRNRIRITNLDNKKRPKIKKQKKKTKKYGIRENQRRPINTYGGWRKSNKKKVGEKKRRNQ